MKHLHALTLAALLSLGAALPAHVAAQAASSTATATAMTEGEVRKIDRDNKKITLKHGEIKNLDMPAMTMVFGVGDAALLDKVQVGDKVRFRASGEGGKFMVTEIQAVK